MTASGIVVVDKPGGMTSHDVVARVRRIMGTRKVGHAGTLDPMATGVLIIGVERATRLLGHLALTDKRYLATVRLGSTTTTDDAEGDLVDTAPAEALAAITDEAIVSATRAYIGEISQVPSSVSAIKVDGRRSYDRVRNGETVTLAAREVTVSRFDVSAITRTDGAIDIDVDVECSTGTYIRALARDLGHDLGVGGHLTRLRRTRVGAFDLDSAVGLDRLAERAESALVPMGTVAALTFPVWELDVDQARAVAYGQRIPWTGPSVSEPVALLNGIGDLLALATDSDGTARYAAVFAADVPPA